MPSGSVEDEVDDESDESSETAGEVVSVDSRPKDPVLFLVDSFERGSRRIDDLYARYEELPGGVKFGFGTVSFLSSAYLGAVVKQTVDSTASAITRSLVSGFSAFRLGTQVVLPILALLVVQVAVANEKLTNIGELVGSKMSDSETTSDGGWQIRRVKKHSTGAFSGAAIGAIFGGMFGYTFTIFSGMVSGAIIGDVIDDWSVRKRRRRRLKTKLVEYLLREHVVEPEYVETETVRNWFPTDDSELATEALEELLTDQESPVTRVSDEKVGLTTPSEAVTYLDRNGGRVPSEFAGPNRPQ